MTKPLCLIALLCLLPAFSGQALAQDRVGMTLSEAVGAALSRNLTLSELRLLVGKSEAEVMVREGEFDPSVSAAVERSYDKESPISDILSTEEDVLSYEVAMGGKLRTGTGYELSYSGGKDKYSDTLFLTTNPYYTSALALTLSQPLLRGFGRAVQESGITVAGVENEMSRLELEHRAMEIIDNTAAAYWELYFRRSDLEVAEASLKLATNTREEVSARIEAGALAEVEIYGAEAEAAAREERLIGARKAVSDAEDALREVMNAGDWQGEIVPVEALPEPDEIPALDLLLGEALNSRRDLRKAIKEQEGRKVLSSYYKNQRLPDLALTGSVGVNGTSGSYGDAIDDTSSGDYYSWGVGVAVSYPLGNRAAKGSHVKAMRDEDIAANEVERIKQSITVEVREARRALDLAKESIEAASKTAVASEKRLRAEEERFRVGLATLNDVLEFQEKYASALSSVKKARTDYAKAKTNLLKATGTLLP